MVARRNICIRIRLLTRHRRALKALCNIRADIRVPSILRLVQRTEQTEVVVRFRVVNAFERHRAGFRRMNVDTADSRRVVHALVIALVVAVRVQRKLVRRAADIGNRSRACVYGSV